MFTTTYYYTVETQKHALCPRLPFSIEARAGELTGAHPLEVCFRHNLFKFWRPARACAGIKHALSRSKKTKTRYGYEAVNVGKHAPLRQPGC